MKIQSTRGIIMATLILIFSLLAFGCAGGTSEATSQKNAATSPTPAASSVVNNAPKETVAPVLEISAPPEINLNAPLKIHWKISNPGDKTIFVYSALLDKNNSALAEIEANRARKSIEIRFTRLTKLTLEPNYFPKTDFLKIEPGKSAEGDFSGKLSLRELLKSAAAPGDWNISALIGYGSEIESAQKLIDNAKGKHPIDPIVEWQKTALSNSFKATIK